MQKLFLLFCLLLSFHFVFPLCFGGGGGGGCGGGCGCGRRKRSIESQPPFTNLAANDAHLLCNSPELKNILLQSVRDIPSESGRSIAATLDSAGDRFVVVCSENPFDYFIHPEMEFCGVKNGSHHCQAFAL